MNLPPLEPIPPGEVRSIAVVKPDHIGDLLINTPVFPALRRHFPQARITAVIGAWAVDVLRNNPHIDEVVSFYPEWLDRSRRGFDLEKHRHNQRTLAGLAARPFDLVINLRDDGDSLYYINIALNNLLCGRWLLSYVKHPEHLNLVTHPVPLRPGRVHALARNVELLQAIGVAVTDPPALYPSPEEEAWAERALAGQPFWVALAPGVGSPERLWPQEKFVALAKALRARNIPLVIVGTKSEAPLGALLEKECGALNLCGQTTLLAMAAVLKRVAVVVNADSAPAHIGAAMGTWVVNIIRPVTRIEFAAVTERCVEVSFPDCLSPCTSWHFERDPSVPIEPCLCIQVTSVDAVKQAVFTALIKAYDAGELPAYASK